MANYGATVDLVLAQAADVGAERICFYDDQFVFIEPSDAAGIGNAIAQLPAGRYKFQVRLNGRWTDIGKSVPVLDARRLLATLEGHEFISVPPIADQEVADAGRIAPERLQRALRKLLYNNIDRQMKQPSKDGLAELCRYFERFRPSWGDDDHYNYFVAYFSLLDAAFREGLRELVAQPTLAGVQRIGQAMLNSSEGQPTSIGYTAAAHCVMGQLLSLLNRDEASARFAKLRASAGADIVQSFYWDSGALTYYSSDDLDPALAADVTVIRQSFEPVQVLPASNPIGIGISMDARFFRVYSSCLYFYAQQLPEIDFNFFICAPPEETRALLHDGEAFTKALMALNRSGSPENVHVYRVPTPEFVVDEMTFFACARFFGAQELLARYRNAYLMDADLYVETHPKAFFERVRNVAVAAPRTTTAAAFSPWRRFMAGNVPLSRAVLDSDILDDLQTYIVHGLRQRGSWMLDQNALTYAIEQDEGRSFVPLNEFKRPFIPLRFMRTWETNYRRANQA